MRNIRTLARLVLFFSLLLLIACSVVLATGSASDDFYAPIADSLAAAIPGSQRVVLAGLRHVAPITDPAPIAELIEKTYRGT